MTLSVLFTIQSGGDLASLIAAKCDSSLCKAFRTLSSIVVGLRGKGLSAESVQCENESVNGMNRAGEA